MLQQFRDYLVGDEFVIRTGHRSMTYIQTVTEVSTLVARNLELLSQFRFNAEHRPGARHQNADTVYRRSQSRRDRYTVNAVTTRNRDGGQQKFVWASDGTKQPVMPGENTESGVEPFNNFPRYNYELEHQAGLVEQADAEVYASIANYSYSCHWVTRQVPSIPGIHRAKTL